MNHALGQINPFLFFGSIEPIAKPLESMTIFVDRFTCDSNISRNSANNIFVKNCISNRYTKCCNKNDKMNVTIGTFTNYITDYPYIQYMDNFWRRLYLPNYSSFKVSTADHLPIFVIVSVHLNCKYENHFFVLFNLVITNFLALLDKQQQHGYLQCLIKLQIILNRDMQNHKRNNKQLSQC